MSSPKWRQSQAKGYLRPSTSELLPGVTTLIKKLDPDPGPLIGWATKLTAEAAEKTREDWEQLKTRAEAVSLIKSQARADQDLKRDIGKRVHDFIEEALRADLAGERRADWPASAQPYLRALEAFQADTGWIPRTVETTVIGLGYAGTYDALGDLPNGTQVLLDWKTGSVRAAAAAQLMLYRAAGIVLHDDGSETVAPEADELWIVQILPGDYEIWRVHPACETDTLQLIASLLTLHEWDAASDRMMDQQDKPNRTLTD